MAHDSMFRRLNSPEMTGSSNDQLVLLLDDDAMITEALGMGLEREGRTVITCNDIESAELIVGRMRPSHVVTDIRLSGPFAFEGLDFVRFIKHHAPESHIILISGDGSTALQREATSRGAAAFLQKPFEIGALDALLDAHSVATPADTRALGSLLRIPQLDDILTSVFLRPHFQPIVSLDGKRTIVGCESLARFRSESPMRNPGLLFEYAERKRRVSDLEMACIGRTMESGAAIAATTTLFINVHPGALNAGASLRSRLLSAAKAAGVPLGRIVVEITEQGSLTDKPMALEVIDELRGLGVRFAFDDFGMAYSHLPLIGRIQPAYLKISQHFGTDFETDPTRIKIINNILALARDFDSTLILEGIEQPSTAAAAVDLGIPLGQGYLFGIPADASIFLNPVSGNGR